MFFISRLYCTITTMSAADEPARGGFHCTNSTSGVQTIPDPPDKSTSIKVAATGSASKPQPASLLNIVQPFRMCYANHKG
uniref:Putative secreted protein n=1 Tax=Ixodes ricinus TaxID=34613 RepID=A0A6B0UCZ4_IXORI